jgi:hypothetical protein
MLNRFFRAARLVNPNSAFRPTLTSIRQFSKINDLKVLGLKEGATSSEIKAAYRLLAKIHHPDVGGNSAEFIEATAAYKRLLQKKDAVSSDSNDEHINIPSSFGILETLLVPKYNKSSFLTMLTYIGKETLCKILQSSDEISLLIINVPENDREKLIDLIGRDHIANIFDLANLFEPDRTLFNARTNSKTHFNRYVLRWNEFKNLLTIVGHDIVLKCLKCDISHLLSLIHAYFGVKECDDFIAYLGKQALNNYIKTYDYRFNAVLKSISKEKQTELMNNLESNYFKSGYAFLQNVTETLKYLDISNHKLFMDLVGEDTIAKLRQQPMHPDHISDFEEMLNKQVEHSPRLKR